MAQLPKLRVRMCVHVERKKGDEAPDAEVLQRFGQTFKKDHWPDASPLPEIYYDPRTLLTGPTRASLHAKCVLVDDEQAFITSANFTEAAQQRNIEAGVLVNNAVFTKAMREQFEVLIRRDLLVRLAITR